KDQTRRPCRGWERVTSTDRPTGMARNRALRSSVPVRGDASTMRLTTHTPPSSPMDAVRRGNAVGDLFISIVEGRSAIGQFRLSQISRRVHSGEKRSPMSNLETVRDYELLYP